MYHSSLLQHTKESPRRRSQDRRLQRLRVTELSNLLLLSWSSTKHERQEERTNNRSNERQTDDDQSYIGQH
jgi:hypothetical protein